MKVIEKGTSNRPERRMVTNKDFDNNHRSKRVLFDKWKNGNHLIQKSDAATEITPVNNKVAEMNGIKVIILTMMILLIIKSFDAKLHLHKDMKRKLMVRNGWNGNILPEHDKPLLDGITNIVHNYMKEHKTKDGVFDLDCMLYRHVKEMVSNNTTYFLYVYFQNSLFIQSSEITRYM